MIGAPFIWTYPAIVVRVVDGDTCRLRIDLGYEIWTEKNCRIAGVDAPELSTAAGRAAKAWATGMLPRDGKCVFTSKQLDKYGRPLGDIAVPGMPSLAQALLDAGHAVPYL
ncbi:MAG: thermonuclease family protein [Mycobacterium sp.]